MQLVNHIKKSVGLLDALQAIQNHTAFITLFLTLIGGAILLTIFSLMGAGFAGHGYFVLGSIVSGIGMVISTVWGLIGINATGLHINDMVNQHTRRPLVNGLIDGAKLFPQLLLFAILLGVAALGVFLAISAAIFISKIPYLGPVLYTFVFPLSALTLGIGLYGWIFLTSLGAPAIWGGNNAFAAIKILWGVLRSSSLLAVVIQTLLLGMLVSLISGLLLGALAFGLSMTSLLSIPILGSDDSNSLSGLLSLMQGSGSGSGHLIASSLGGGVLSAAVLAAPFLIALAGNCIIFRNITDTEATRTSDSCPACHAPTAPGDLYCGNCGQSLQ